MATRYGTVEGFRQYHEERGRDTDDWTDGQVSVALLNGSEWLDFLYRDQYPGRKVGNREQERNWPRYDAYDVHDDLIPSDAVPVEIEYGAYEAAWVDATTPGSLLKDYTPGKYKRVSIDGAISVDFADVSDANGVQTQFMSVSRVIAPVLTATGSGFSSLSGAVTRV